MTDLPGLTDYIQAKASGMKIPVNGNFELLPACNFKCEYCYIHSQSSESLYKKSHPSADDWLKVVDSAKEKGLLFLLLTGGEPLLYDGFDKIYDYSVKSGIVVSVNTNGSLINEDLIKLFRNNLPRQINISLYGTNNEIYRDLCGTEKGFDKVDRAVRLLKQNGIPFKFNCVLNQKNVSDAESIIKYSKEAGTFADFTTYVYPPVRNEDFSFGNNKRLSCEEAASMRLKIYRLTHSDAEYRLFLENIVSSGTRKVEMLSEKCDGESKMSCRAGKSSFWINWKLEMTPCGMMGNPSADLKKISFEEAWKSISGLYRDCSLPEKCLSCPMAGICGVCAASAYAESGNLTDIPVYICQTADCLVTLAKQQMKCS